jgi:hypothetical protein
VESWSPGGVHLESVGEGKLHEISPRRMKNCPKPGMKKCGGQE